MKQNEKYVYYIFSDEFLQKAKNGETISSEEASKFQVSEEKLKDILNEQNCYVEEHSTTTCTCRKPGQPPYQATGTCDVYYRQEGGVRRYCYTRCPSCYVICG